MSEIKVKVVIDGQESIQTIDELNQSLDSFKKNTEGLDSGSEEVDKFNKSIEDLQKTLDDGLKLDLDADALNAKLGEVSNDLTQITGQQFEIKVDVPEKTINSVGALRREYQQLLAQLESTDPQTAEYKELESRLVDVGTRAAQARDKIDDFNEGIRIRTGSPIEQFRNSLNLTKEGILNLDFDKAKAGFAGIGNSVKGVIPPLNGLKGAIIATGVGALIVAVGLLIANFDKLKEVLFDFSSEESKLLKQSEDRLKIAEAELEDFESSLNVRRQQGQTEIQILQARIQLLKVTLEEKKEQLDLQKKLAQEEIARTQRNKTILTLLGLQGGLVKGLADLTAGLDLDTFNVEKSIEDGNETVRQAELAITKIEDTIAASELKINDIKTSNLNKRLNEEEKYRKEIEALEEKYILSQEELIRKKYQKELDAIKGNTEAEKLLREAIIARRDEELADISQEKIDREVKLKQDILRLRAETADEIKKIELENVDIETEILLRKAETEDEKTLILLQAEQKRKEIVEKFLNEENQAVISKTEEQISKIESARDRIFSQFESGEIGIFGSIKKLEESFKQERAAYAKQAQDLIDIQQKIIDSTTSTPEERAAAEAEILKIKEDAAKKDLELTKENEEAKSEIVNTEIQKRIQQAQQAVDIVQSFSDTQLENERSRLDILARENEQYFDGERERIENSTLSEEEKQKALDELAQRENDRKNDLAKQDLILKKKEIKRERAFAIARIALGIASSFPDGIKAAVKTDPVSFALTLAANLALIVGTLAAAKRALNDADSQIGALGGDTGGGGGNIPLPSPTGGGGGTQQFSPSGFQPTGVNPALTGGGGAAQQIPVQSQQFVSVVEIERVRNSVQAVETSNTISGGG